MWVGLEVWFLVRGRFVFFVDSGFLTIAYLRILASALVAVVGILTQ